MKRGILYYTDNGPDEKILRACQKQLLLAGLPITSVSLKPMDFGKNIVLDLERGYKTMYQQILTGLLAMKEDVVYFAECDVLYHPSHFDFIPTDPETWYYNGNYWFLRYADGFAVHYDVSPLSGLVVSRESAIKHFTERIELINRQGFGLYMGFEPFTHNRVPWKYWCNFEVFMSAEPNIDICHGKNLSWKRWSPRHFRKKPKFWEESNLAELWCRNLLPPAV